MTLFFKYFNSFSKEVDFEKLKWIKERTNIKTVDTKLHEYNKETHTIMQKHFEDKEIVEFGRLLLMYIKIIKDDKDHLKQMKRERFYSKKFLKKKD